MIFVTIGTHEQQFNRLIEKVDLLKKNNVITEEVFIQSGYSTYKPKYCNFKELLSNEEMDYYTKKAKIIITHGGPGSIFGVIKDKKIPIVVPRNPNFYEHVDNHQILFAKRLEKQNKILAVYDIDKLEDIIINYNNSIQNKNMLSTTSLFIKEFEKIINRLG